MSSFISHIFYQKSDITQFHLKDQKGQTLIEFLLLLVSIVAIAFTFMRLINGNLGEQWTNMSQVILEDPSQRLEIR